MNRGERISKVMAHRGWCSRREADEWITRGWVLLDGQVVSELGTRMEETQELTLHPDARRNQQRQLTVLLHKPVGWVSGQAESGYRPAVQLVTPATRWDQDRIPLVWTPAVTKRLAPAGRLDIDSTGLLVLTQDGRIARTLIGAESEIEKEYLVRVTGRLDALGLSRLNHGLSLDGQALRPARVSWQNEDQLRFVLKEGKKRQIRRMCELVGLRVVGLKRVRIGRIVLGALPLGQWRLLTDQEIF